MDEQPVLAVEEKSHPLYKKILNFLEQLLWKINHQSIASDYCNRVVTEIIEDLDEFLRIVHYSVREDQEDTLVPKIYDLIIWLFACM